MITTRIPIGMSLDWLYALASKSGATGGIQEKTDSWSTVPKGAISMIAANAQTRSATVKTRYCHQGMESR
jgi:hypothetical protein